MGETFVVGRPEYGIMKQLIKEHALELFREHVGHTLEFQEDSPNVLWVKCLDCDKLWTHCSLCIFSGRGSPIDFGCVKCSVRRPLVSQEARL